MPSTAYRFRRCPRCGSVFPGGQLRVLRYGEGHYHKRGGSLRRCPKCGHKGFTQDFTIVKGGKTITNYVSGSKRASEGEILR